MCKYSYFLKNIFDVLGLFPAPTPHIYAYQKIQNIWINTQQNFSISGMDSSLNHFGFFSFCYSC